MNNRKKVFTLIILLLAIVVLGIGYAAVTTLLEITGTATVLPSDGVELNFTGTPSVTGGQSGTQAAIDSNDATKATCTVVLKNYNESAVCQYTIQNVSTDQSLSASNIAISAYEDSNYQSAWSASSSDYLTINTNIDRTTLGTTGNATATVTVTLKKENTTGSNIIENFYIKVVGETTQN